MTSKAPAYQRYPKDYMSDGNVLRMTFEERGIYDWLLDSCWIEDGIPSEIEEISRICNIGLRKANKVWQRIGTCFIPHPRKPGWLTNRRLEEQRAEQLEFRAAMEKAGRKGAEKRWGGHSQANGQVSSQATERPMAKNSSAVCSLQSAVGTTTAAAGLRTAEANGNGAHPPAGPPAGDRPPTISGLALEAHDVLGMGTWGDDASEKFNETKGIIRRHWHGRGVKLESVRAAIRGLRLMVDRGDVSWLEDRKGKPLDGLEVLTKNAVVPGSDGGQLGSLFAQAERAWREHELEDPPVRTVRGGGPQRIDVALAKMGTKP